MGMKPIVRVSAVVAMAAMLAGTAFMSATSVSAAPDKEKSTKDPLSRRICRTVTPSGSRLTTRICRTQAEWELGQDKTQDGVLQFQMKEQTTYAQVPG